MLVLGIALFSAAPQTCDLAGLSTVRAVHEVLGRRAVDIVSLASAADGQSTARLSGLVKQDASFSLGAGDVGIPLGEGVEGARLLAERMKADSFRFLGWDYMDAPVTPCSSQTITVEFSNSASQLQSEVEFTFVDGRVTKASGWQRSFETGPIPTTSAK